MHELTQLIKEDMRPALGVTEPGAIAYAVSKAKSYVPGELEQVTLLLNSGMYKNAYTCGIPNSHFYGNEYAAALGAVAGKPEKELESLANVTEADNVAAEQLVKDGKQAERLWFGSAMHIQILFVLRQMERCFLRRKKLLWKVDTKKNH